ncbi:hypothetical protein [Streptomyces sp. NPDC006012]
MKRPEATHEPARLRRVRIPGTVIAPPRPHPKSAADADAAAPATGTPR